jgi:hypothetical protein
MHANERCLRPLKAGAGMAGYAHFPGTGPTGTDCRTCQFRALRGGAKNICTKYAQLMRISEAKAPPIQPGTQSCRYYEKKK